MTGGWFDLATDVTVGDLTPPTACCYCDLKTPTWRWECEPFAYPIFAFFDDNVSAVEVGMWTSRSWLACNRCFRLEHRGRTELLVGRAVGAMLFRAPELGEMRDRLPAFLTGLFAAARTAFIGPPALLPPDLGG